MLARAIGTPGRPPKHIEHSQGDAQGTGPVPTRPRAWGTSTESTLVTWSGLTDEEHATTKGYEVQARQGSGRWRTLKLDHPHQTQVEHVDLEPGKRYEYRVRTLGEAEDSPSAWSPIGRARTESKHWEELKGMMHEGIMRPLHRRVLTSLVVHAVKGTVWVAAFAATAAWTALSARHEQRAAPAGEAGEPGTASATPGTAPEGVGANAPPQRPQTLPEGEGLDPEVAQAVQRLLDTPLDASNEGSTAALHTPLTKTKAPAAGADAGAESSEGSEQGPRRTPPPAPAPAGMSL